MRVILEIPQSCKKYFRERRENWNPIFQTKKKTKWILAKKYYYYYSYYVIGNTWLLPDWCAHGFIMFKFPSEWFSCLVLCQASFSAWLPLLQLFILVTPIYLPCVFSWSTSTNNMDHCPYPCRWVVLILFTGATCCFANKIVAPEHLTTTPSPVIPAARSPPNITVYNGTAEEDANVHYYDQSSQNEFIFQNDTVFVLPTTRTSIKFMCEANYPILWNLAGSKLVRNSYHAIRVLTIRKFEDAFDPTTFTYQSILALEGYGINEELSGKYICRSSQNVELASSIQLFWQSKWHILCRHVYCL